MASVLVVGGGVIGVCSAYFLAQEGFDVALVEQGDVAAGSSYGNAGLITPSDSLPLPAPGTLTKGLAWLLDPASPLYIPPRWDWELIRWLWRFRAAANGRTFQAHVPVLQALSRRSLELAEAIIAREHIDCHYRRRGLLILYRTSKGFEEGQHLAQLVKGFGLASEVWSRDAVAAKVPLVTDAVVGGMYFSTDAHLDPAAFVRGLAARLPAMGVHLHTHTEVIDFRVERGRVTTVVTTRGDWHPDQVVLAAGAWTPLLARHLGLRLPIQPAKGYSITVQRPEGFPELPLILDEAKVAVTPMGDRLRFAGTLELGGHSLTITRRRVEAIRQAVPRYLQLDPAAQPLVELWRGLRPCTPDGLPIIGRPQGLANLVIAAGHCMLGMTQAAATGKLVADLISGRKPEIDIQPFRVERF